MELRDSKIVWNEEAYVLYERPSNNPFRTPPPISEGIFEIGYGHFSCKSRSPSLYRAPEVRVHRIADFLSMVQISFRTWTINIQV